MGLTSKTVKIKWGANTKKHYESLGYVYTKMGDEFEVKVEDLNKGSHVEVCGFCDCCKEEKVWAYKNYLKGIRNNGEIYCQSCAIKLYGSNNSRRGKLQKSKSFEQWCIENNRQDVLDRWDYELNDCLPSEVSYASGNSYYFKYN